MVFDFQKNVTKNQYYKSKKFLKHRNMLLNYVHEEPTNSLECSRYWSINTTLCTSEMAIAFKEYKAYLFKTQTVLLFWNSCYQRFYGELLLYFYPYWMWFLIFIISYEKM